MPKENLSYKIEFKSSSNVRKIGNSKNHSENFQNYCIEWQNNFFNDEKLFHKVLNERNRSRKSTFCHHIFLNLLPQNFFTRPWKKWFEFHLITDYLHCDWRIFLVIFTNQIICLLKEHLLSIKQIFSSFKKVYIVVEIKI